MTIEFRCDCGELFQVEDELAGRKGRCPTCKRIMVVPEKEPEPLELREEIKEEEEEEFFKAVAESELHQPAAEPPMGSRVEEEVEVLRGWEGPEPDLEKMETASHRASASHWPRIPKPLLLGVPAAVVVVVILILLLSPSGRAPKQEALERAPSPSLAEKPPATPKIKEEPAPSQPEPQPSTESPKAQVSSGSAGATTGAMQSEKPLPAKPAPVAAGKEEEKRSAAVPSAPAGSAPPKPQASTKEAKPKEPPPKPRVPPAARALSPASENYTVNVGAFKSQGMAEAFADVLRKKGLDPFVWATKLTKGQGKMYRVSVGRFPTKRQADMYAKELKEKHGLNTYVAKKPGT